VNELLPDFPSTRSAAFGADDRAFLERIAELLAAHCAP